MRRGILAGVATSDVAVLALEVSTLRAQVAELLAERDERRRRRLHQDDPPFLARLLPALSGAWGPDEYFVRDALDNPGLEQFTRGWNVLALAKLFARAAGVPIGDYVLVDCGHDAAEGIRKYRVDGVDGGSTPVARVSTPAESTAL